jgi:hypothetical protein
VGEIPRHDLCRRETSQALAGMREFDGRPQVPLTVMVKAIALVAGFAIQIPLWIAGYLIGGFERVLPELGRQQVDLEQYSPRKSGGLASPRSANRT